MARRWVCQQCYDNVMLERLGFLVTIVDPAACQYQHDHKPDPCVSFPQPGALQPDSTHDTFDAATSTYSDANT